MSVSKSRAILSLVPGAIFSEADGVIQWQCDLTQPTDQAIQDEMDRLDSDEPLRLLRVERTRKLKKTDWTSGEDVPQSIKDAYFPYRQALRDITDTYSSLDSAEGNWPIEPS